MKHIAVINDLSGAGRCSLTIALPVLSVMGIEASPLPTAVLSNHTGFPYTASFDFTPEMEAFFKAWEQNGFHFDGVLIGYLANPLQAEMICRFIAHERAANADFCVILDPAMADNGHLYRNLPENQAEAMRLLFREADLSCPNLTEACLLGDFDYEGMKETMDSLESDAGRLMVLHSLFSELSHMTGGTVLITGIEDGENLINAVSEPGKDIYFVRARKSGGSRPGTGDLFSAVIAGAVFGGRSIRESTAEACEFTREVIAHSEEVFPGNSRELLFEECLFRLLPESR